MNFDLSCICFCYSSENKPIAISVGLWMNMTVQLLSMDLSMIWNIKIRDDVIPRSLVHCYFGDDESFLFIGLGDGGLITVELSSALLYYFFLLFCILNRITKQSQRRLGSQAVMLTRFLQFGTTHVFAACDRPTIIYSSVVASEKRMFYSNANVNQANVMVYLFL